MIGLFCFALALLASPIRSKLRPEAENAVFRYRRDEDIAASQGSDDDPHLRGVEEIIGYHIHGDDGEIGHVEDFLVEEADWSIHYLVVDTVGFGHGISRSMIGSKRGLKPIRLASSLGFLVRRPLRCQRRHRPNHFPIEVGWLLLDPIFPV